MNTDIGFTRFAKFVVSKPLIKFQLKLFISRSWKKSSNMRRKLVESFSMPANHLVALFQHQEAVNNLSAVRIHSIFGRIRPTQWLHATPKWCGRKLIWFCGCWSCESVNPFWFRLGVLSNSLQQIIHSSDFYFHQVFNKQLSLAVQASQQKCQANQWGAMLISTATFTKAIFTVTGKDIGVFVDTWVRQGGHARFQLSFFFNRQRLIAMPCYLDADFYYCFWL